MAQHLTDSWFLRLMKRAFRNIAFLFVLFATSAGLIEHVKAQSASQPSRAAQKDKPQTPKTPEAEIVRVDTDITNIFFTATDKDRRYVTTITQADLTVLEDGKPQKLFAFQRETDRPLSLAILVDVSASQQVTLPLEKTAARRFVDSIVRSGKDEVAIISFTGDATIEQDLTSDLPRLRRAIDQVEVVFPPGYIGGGIVVSTPNSNNRVGSTAIWDAICATSQDLLTPAASQKRHAIILITDGFDTSSYLRRAEAVQRALKADAAIYAIGIGDSRNFDGVDKGSLRKVSEQTGGRAYFPKSEADLHAAFTEIEQELRSQYLIAYSPENKNRDGSYRQVEIEVTNPELKKQKLHLNYRPGYFPTVTTPTASQ